MKRIAIMQTTTGLDPLVSAEEIAAQVISIAKSGTAMLFTPEMSGMMDRDRKRAATKIACEEDDAVLGKVREAAAKTGVWVALGSLAIVRQDGRWVNRSFVIDGSGNIAARYDKIHMFDVDLASGETWRESSAYEPGDTVVTVDTPVGRLGLAICYDVRFPALFDALGRAKCDVIALPAAFTVPTGAAHWHLLARARAVEASAYVIAAAQVGVHEDGRTTYGHSLVVDPWGDILLDLGEQSAGLAFTEIGPERIAAVRAQLPSLANRRTITN